MGESVFVQEPSCGSNMCTNRPQSSPLNLLPSEVLEKIFDYLSPKDLVSIRQLNNRRITYISLTMKCADFSEGNTFRKEDVSAFFTEDRVLHIKEINFDKMFFVSSSTLVKCLVKCKNLRKLSVFKCGWSYTNIVSILESCEELEVLSFDLDEILSDIELSLLDREEKKPLKLKNISLLGSDVESRDLILHDILKRCDCPIEVYWNRKHYYITLSSICEDSHPLVLDVKFTMIFVFMEDDLKYSRNSIAVSRFAIKVPEGIEGQEEALNFSVPCPFSLKFIKEFHQKAIQTLPSNSVKSMILVMADENLCLEKHIENLKRITGDKLLSLTICTHAGPPISQDSEEDDRMPNFTIPHKLVTAMTSTCINIQSLNICDLHFDMEFSFNSLSHLTNLKTLIIPPCTLKTGYTGSKDHLINAAKLQVQGFKNFVLKCKKVESFSLEECSICYSGPFDEDIMAIAMWPKLSRISISSVRSLRCCSFLAQVADWCPELQVLQLAGVGNRKECHFLPNVVPVLQKCKQLIFLRINQEAFNYDSPLFWSSLALAQNLQGLCLSSDLDFVMEKEIILDAVSKLPYLHQFHLHWKKVPSDLIDQVNEMMKKNGMEVFECFTE